MFIRVSHILRCSDQINSVTLRQSTFASILSWSSSAPATCRASEPGHRCCLPWFSPLILSARAACTVSFTLQPCHTATLRTETKQRNKFSWQLSLKEVTFSLPLFATNSEMDRDQIITCNVGKPCWSFASSSSSHNIATTVAFMLDLLDIFVMSGLGYVFGISCKNFLLLSTTTFDLVFMFYRLPLIRPSISSRQRQWSMSFKSICCFFSNLHYK